MLGKATSFGRRCCRLVGVAQWQLVAGGLVNGESVFSIALLLWTILSILVVRGFPPFGWLVVMVGFSHFRRGLIAQEYARSTFLHPESDCFSG